jgi:hypothetical protein
VEEEIINEKGKIKKKYDSDLDAAIEVVRIAARIFGGDWEGFMDATTYAFLGIEWHGSGTMLLARIQERDFKGYFGKARDTGYHDDFRDGNNQIYHFWAGFASAVQPNSYNSYPGQGSRASGAPIISHIGNIWHDNPIFDSKDPYDGKSARDYSLTLASIDIAKQVGPNKLIQNPSDLVWYLDKRLGEFGPGSNGFVDQYSGLWKTPDN